MQQLQWGIIGCGDVTEVKSGPAFNKVSNSALAAVMRRDAARAKDYARRHNVPNWYSNAAELISDANVTAIYVATPPSTHEEYTLAAINAGKPVYVEKPMANNYAAALSMANAAAEKNIPMVVAHYRRQQPRFQRLKQLLADKAIGDVLFATIQLSKTPLTNNDLTDPKIAWRVDPAVAGGGLFHDLAPHQLDLLCYFFGPVEKVTGVATMQGTVYPATDMVAGTIQFKSGVVFTGTWCFNAPADVDTFEITGTAGTIMLSVFSGDTITVKTSGQQEILTFDKLPHVQQPMIQAVVNYFNGEGENPCTGHEGAEVMRLMEAMTAG